MQIDNQESVSAQMQAYLEQSDIQIRKGKIDGDDSNDMVRNHSSETIEYNQRRERSQSKRQNRSGNRNTENKSRERVTHQTVRDLKKLQMNEEYSAYYTFTEVLGEGSFCTVYKAFDKEAQEVIAVKVSY